MATRNYRWVILAIGFVILFVGSGSRNAFGLFLKPMASDLEWTRSEVSLIQAIFLIVSALAMPFAGRLIDKYNIRYILFVSVLISSIGIGAVAVANTGWQVYVLYGIIFALGSTGMSLIPVGVMVNRWFATGRGFANGLATSGTSFGQLVIVAILASMLTSIGWRDAYLYLAVITAVVLLPLVVFGIRSEPSLIGKYLPVGKLIQDHRDSISDSLVTVPRHFAKEGQFWILILVYSCCGFLDFFVVTHVVAFATDQGVGEVTAGNLLAIMGLCGLAGVLLTGALADAFGTPRPVILCFGLRTCVFVLILISQSTPSIMIYALVYGFTFLMTAPLTVVFAQNIFGGTHLGTISGIITTAHHIAAGLGAYLGAVIYDSTGSYQLAYVLMLFIAILGGITTLFVREKPIYIPDS